MKVALVTTPTSIRSGIGDYTRHLLPYLREHCDVQLFVAPGLEACPEDPEDLRSVTELVPREWDQVLYQLGNEQNHHFMPRMVREVGGTVMQHDWVLFDLMLSAHPGLVRGGWKGHLLALREGGLGQLRLYARNWIDRRAQRVQVGAEPGGQDPPGELLWGWHAPESAGRWTGDSAAVRLPAADCRGVRVVVLVEQSRHVQLMLGQEVLCELAPGEQELVAELPAADHPVLTISTRGIRVTAEQRAHGDTRRLGVFVKTLEYDAGSGWRGLDLDQPAEIPLRIVTLTRDRFDLTFNRSITRFADAFIVHSEYLKQKILRDRNAITPVGVLPHGAERRWRDEERAVTRRRLGLTGDWEDAFLITSFGGVQRHKRIGRLLSAVARAREQRADVRLLMAGGYDPEDLDPRAEAERLGIGDAVRVLGWVEEETAWDCIHAGEVCVNLRGPTSGGTSGGIYQSLAFGRPVIATGAAEQIELPDACIPKVPLGEGETEQLAALIVELRDDPERRRELEAAARRYVDEECHWSHAARLYSGYLESFPGPRSARRSLLSLVGERAAARRTS